MNRLLVLVVLTILIGIVAAYPSTNKRLFGLGRRTAGQFEAGRAFDVTKKNTEMLSGIDKLKNLVEILKRHSDQEQKTQQQQARELPKYLSGQLRGADEQKVGGQQENIKRHHEEEGPEPWEIYIHLIVEKLGYNAPVEEYYKEIRIQQEILLKSMMEFSNDCNEKADCKGKEECSNEIKVKKENSTNKENEHVFQDVEREVQNIAKIAEESYSAIHQEWDVILGEFAKIEEEYNRLEQMATPYAENSYLHKWKEENSLYKSYKSDQGYPVCWFTIEAMDKEMSDMHRAVYGMKSYEYYYTYSHPSTK